LANFASLVGWWAPLHILKFSLEKGRQKGQNTKKEKIEERKKNRGGLCAENSQKSNWGGTGNPR